MNNGDWYTVVTTDLKAHTGTVVGLDWGGSFDFMMRQGDSTVGFAMKEVRSINPVPHYDPVVAQQKPV